MVILKFFWTRKKIAFALDYKIDERCSPLSTFYFFPKENGWEKIKQELLNNKTWINKNVSESILNKLTEVIEYWRINKSSNKSVVMSHFKTFEHCFLIGSNFD